MVAHKTTTSLRGGVPRAIPEIVSSHVPERSVFVMSRAGTTDKTISTKLFGPLEYKFCHSLIQTTSTPQVLRGGREPEGLERAEVKKEEELASESTVSGGSPSTGDVSKLSTPITIPTDRAGVDLER